VTGLRARGGFEIEKLQWREGRVNHLIVKSLQGGKLVLRSAQPLLSVKRTKVPVPYHPARHTVKIDLTPLDKMEGNLYVISAEEGQQIEIVTPYSKF
jgi:alpha-L-fucosidase 2